MYDISFNDGAAVSYPDRILISDVHEGENRIHGYSIYNFDVGGGYTSTENPPCKYVWPIYKLASGMTRVGSKIPLSDKDFQNNNKHIDLPNGLLLEPGKLKIQIFATSSAANIDTIVDEYSEGTFSDKIIKSDVYEIFVTGSLDPIEELVGPGGISQAAREYLTDLVDELIAEGIHIDTALSTTSVNAVENRVITTELSNRVTNTALAAALADKADKNNTVITGSFSLGRASNSTIGSNSTAEGNNVTASGDNSHAEGVNGRASGYASHAEGRTGVASGSASHVEGYGNTASGDNAHAEGYGCSASAKNSHAEGKSTKASSEDQHVQGHYNIEDSGGNYAHIVGNGTGSSSPSNAHTLDWSGNAWFAGDVKVGGTGQNDTEAKKLITIDDVLDDQLESNVLFHRFQSSGSPSVWTEMFYDVDDSEINAYEYIGGTVNDKFLSYIQYAENIRAYFTIEGASTSESVDPLPNGTEDPQEPGTYAILYNAAPILPDSIARVKRIEAGMGMFVIAVGPTGILHVYSDVDFAGSDSLDFSFYASSYVTFLDIDDAVVQGGKNPVQGNAVYKALAEKAPIKPAVLFQLRLSTVNNLPKYTIDRQTCYTPTELNEIVTTRPELPDAGRYCAICYDTRVSPNSFRVLYIHTISPNYVTLRDDVDQKLITLNYTGGTWKIATTSAIYKTGTFTYHTSLGSTVDLNLVTREKDGAVTVCGTTTKDITTPSSWPSSVLQLGSISGVSAPAQPPGHFIAHLYVQNSSTVYELYGTIDANRNIFFTGGSSGSTSRTGKVVINTTYFA